jgi:hypothetical protein
MIKSSRIRNYMGTDPDLDPDPDPSITNQKPKKNFDLNCFVTEMAG